MGTILNLNSGAISNFRLNSWRITLATLAGFLLLLPARAATNPVPRLATDLEFAPGLANVKRAIGFTDAPGPSSFDWSPNFQLLVGVKSVDGAKHVLSFVELATLRPPATNAAGQPWHPALRTNTFTFSTSNKTVSSSIRFISHLCTVRVRVFDESGRTLKEGRTLMPWELCTNGLAEMCRLSLLEKSPPANHGPSAASIRAFGGGMYSLVFLFQEFQEEPALADICKQAFDAVRLPGFLSLAASVVKGNINLNLNPRFPDIVPLPAGAAGSDATYRLPVDLLSGKKILTTIDLLVGPSGGAPTLLSGIRAVHFTHPTNAKKEFTAQILAIGTAAETNAPAK